MQILYGQLTEDSGTDTVTGPEPEAVKATDPVPLSILHGPEVPLAAPLMIVAVVAGQSHTLLPKTTNGEVGVIVMALPTTNRSSSAMQSFGHVSAVQTMGLRLLSEMCADWAEAAPTAHGGKSCRVS